MQAFVLALVEQTAGAFLTTWLGVWGTTGHSFDSISDPVALKAGGAAAVLMFANTLLTKLRGDKNSGLWTQ